MSDGSERAGDSETVAAVLDRMDGLTREQWLERLNWVPDGLEPVCQAGAATVVPVMGDAVNANVSGKPFTHQPQRKKKLHV